LKVEAGTLKLEPATKNWELAMPDRSRARELAARFIASGDPNGWFEALYREAEEGRAEVPWADLRPNPHLISFWSAQPEKWVDAAVSSGGARESAKTALVIGSGFGDDAEQLAAWGFKTTAFDISDTAIRVARRRFPVSAVEYVTADLFAPPASWIAGFDFVLEAYTLQVFPAALRRKVIEMIARLVRPRGRLLVIARGREPSDPEGQMPWPLTRIELDYFTSLGLEQQRFEDFSDAEEPGVRRFRALYQRS
jgi:SAM-dependent methyltransferase